MTGSVFGGDLICTQRGLERAHQIAARVMRQAQEDGGAKDEETRAPMHEVE